MLRLDLHLALPRSCRRLFEKAIVYVLRSSSTENHKWTESAIYPCLTNVALASIWKLSSGSLNVESEILTVQVFQITQLGLSMTAQEPSHKPDLHNDRLVTGVTRDVSSPSNLLYAKEFLAISKRCNVLTLIVAENIRIVKGQIGRECQVFVALPAT